jgi:hypothetical protein
MAMSAVALATWEIPGVDIVTGGAALATDILAGVTNVINAGLAFSKHDYPNGAIDALSAGLSFVGAGLSVRAMEALS